MQALILAGGMGKRLRPVTDYLPKPLVPVRNVPIIEWQIRYLRRHGIRDVVVCSGYRGGQLEDYIGARRGLGARVSFSTEREPLGTGGAIRRAAGMVRGRSFVVLNGDVITDIDIGRLRRSPNCIAAIPLRTKYGVVRLDGGSVAGFEEKREVAGAYMNAGVYHLSAGALADLPRRGDIERTLFPDYARRGLLRAERFHGARWHSIDSIKDLEECAAEAGEIAG